MDSSKNEFPPPAVKCFLCSIVFWLVLAALLYLFPMLRFILVGLLFVAVGLGAGWLGFRWCAGKMSHYFNHYDDEL